MTRRPLLLASAICAAGVLAASASAAAAHPFLPGFSSITRIASAVPANGDQNPYGVAVVPRTIGDLVQGDVLVSDFNNSLNQQGTGSTIMEISPRGAAKPFAVIPPPTATPATGLTTALVALSSGYVVVGSLPAPGGQSSAMTAGALTILNPSGQVVENYTAPDINGPWDMTALDQGSTAWLFVTNVLNGTVAANGNTVNRGTVVRLELSIPSNGSPSVVSNRMIATGFPERTDPNALVVGPTGVGLGSDGTLYVADSDSNRIAAIPHAVTRLGEIAGGGQTVSVGGGLNDPLGLTIAPNGDILSANGANGNIIETLPSGSQVAAKTVVPNGAGDLFGLAVTPSQNGIYFVNDAGSGPAANSLELLH